MSTFFPPVNALVELEIGLEEIPARMMDAAWEEMATRVFALLKRESLLSLQETTGAGLSTLVTPRRLAFVMQGVAASQPDVTEQIPGPSTKVAFKDGQPTPAAAR